jgi:hypothetical protein
LADRYWNPAADANWGDANVWALTDGGDPTGIATPTSGDDVYFTSTNVHKCTVAGMATCKNLSFTGGTGFTGIFTGTTGGSAFGIFGNLTLYSGMTWSCTADSFNFMATSGTQLITTAGKTISSPIDSCGAGGTRQLQDALNIGSSILRCEVGILDTNGQTVTCGNFSGENGNAHTISLGSSIFNCISWTVNATFTTVICGTSSIRITGTGAFSGAGKTYYEVQLNGTAHTVSGANQFTNLIRTGTAVKTDSVTFAADQVITGTLTLNGNSAINRLFVKSDVAGTARTLTAAAVASNAADFRDIIGAGVGSWDLSGAAQYSGDCGHNSGITFTALGTQIWYQDTGNFSASNWYAGTGGTGGATRVPLPQDLALFDALSFSAGSKTVTLDMPRMGGISFNNVTNNPAFASGSGNLIFGNLVLAIGTMTTSGTSLTFSSRGSKTINSNGKTINFNVYIDAITGTVTLGDALLSGLDLYLTSGTFDANGQTVTCRAFISSNVNTRILTMGSGLWTIIGISSMWNCATVTGLTITTPNSSTIKLTNNSASSKTFEGGGKTYGNFWNATAGTGVCIMKGSNTFTDFKIDAGRTQQFEHAKTQTVTTFTAIGTSGSHIVLTRDATSAALLAKSGGGTIIVDYCDISWTTVSPATTWYATNYTDNGNNSGWTWGAPVTAGKYNFLAFF